MGRPGVYRHEVCPAWVTSLPQAELCAGYAAMCLAAYRGLHAVNIGFDNDAARAQCASLQALTQCNAQQRILRKMFWLRAWAIVDLARFRVPSACNPVDSLSRVHEFLAREDAIAEAESRRRAWGIASYPYTFISHAIYTPSVYGALARG